MPHTIFVAEAILSRSAPNGFVGSARETNRPSPSRRLGEIQATELRVDCARCFKIVRELKRDLIARWGADATWKDVGQRLLAERCEIRTGSHEQDGCWPDFRN